MTIRNVIQRVEPMEVSEGAGVTVHRSIGIPALRNLDPFLMLDHFSSNDPDDYIAGFPDHPHRGFVTVTYMLDGHMLHQDSMGNRGDLRSGGVQWMKAASGIIHSEMPQQTAGLMRGFQLWINLPAAKKMSDPDYQEFSPERVPQVLGDGFEVRVICGEYDGQRGPVEDPFTGARYMHVRLQPGARFGYALEGGLTAFLYLFEGAALIGDTAVGSRNLAVLGPGERLDVEAGDVQTEFILLAGQPIGEPIVQYGPFVMNSREEIEQAMADYRTGRLVRKKAHMRGA